MRRLVPPPVTDLHVRQVEDLDQLVQVRVGVVERPDVPGGVQRLLPLARVRPAVAAEDLRSINRVLQRRVNVEDLPVDDPGRETAGDRSRRAEHQLSWSARRHVNHSVVDPSSSKELKNNFAILISGHRATQPDHRPVFKLLVNRTVAVRRVPNAFEASGFELVGESLSVVGVDGEGVSRHDVGRLAATPRQLTKDVGVDVLALPDDRRRQEFNELLPRDVRRLPARRGLVAPRSADLHYIPPVSVKSLGCATRGRLVAETSLARPRSGVNWLGTGSFDRFA